MRLPRATPKKRRVYATVNTLHAIGSRSPCCSAIDIGCQNDGQTSAALRPRRATAANASETPCRTPYELHSSAYRLHGFICKPARAPGFALETEVMPPRERHLRRTLHSTISRDWRKARSAP